MTKRAEDKARTRHLVLDTARRVFDRVGFDAATIRGIAAEMNMSTGAIFGQFTGKEALYEAVYGHPPVTPEAGRQMITVIGFLLPYAIAAVGLPRASWPSDSVILQAEAVIASVDAAGAAR